MPNTHPAARSDASGAPVSRDSARAILDEAAELVTTGDYADAAAHYRRVVGFNDPQVKAAALLGLAQSLYRLDDEDAAIATWESILELPETPSTYMAWREVAAARVRHGDLQGAIAAYREADRRAPREDKAAIANRLGWLAKETGNARAAGRYFARGREVGPAFPLAWVIIGATAVVSFMGFSSEGTAIQDALMLDKGEVARGEYWRLLTVTLVHKDIVHLAMNMIGLFIAGPLLEQLYGPRLFVLFYVLCGLGGSVASFALGSAGPSVGASGAVFGLFGILIAARRAHHPVLDRQDRTLLARITVLIGLNVLLGFANPQIDNAAHLGGLAAGAWLGVLIIPGRVPTFRSMWQRPTTSSDPAKGGTILLPALGVAALLVVLAVGVVAASGVRRSLPAATNTADLGGGSYIDPASLDSVWRPEPLPNESVAIESARRAARMYYPSASLVTEVVARGPLGDFCDQACRSLSYIESADVEVWDISLATVDDDGEVEIHFDLEVATGNILVFWTNPPYPY
jgi:membrane associated rhomboid family serine protease